MSFPEGETKDMTGSEVYHLTFHRGMANQPILHTLGRRFRVSVTLRRAMLSEEGGWVEVVLTGPAEEIGRAVADLQTTGVSITGPLETQVEPDAEAHPVAAVGRGT